MSARHHSRQTGRRRRCSARTETARSTSRSLYRRKLRYEPLEDRRVLALVTVTTLADTVDFDDGVTSLREAIFATNLIGGPDTIDFAPSLISGARATILLTHGELGITDDLTINGPGANRLTIDASGSDPTPEVRDGLGTRIVGISGVIDVSIRGITLTSGDSNFRGGAILTTLASLTLQDTVITGNASGESGGGIYASDGAIVLKSTVVSNNVAAIRGGAVFSAYCNLLVDSCSIINNQSVFSGGGIDASATNGRAISIRDSTITGNSTSASSNAAGGGAYMHADNGSSIDVIRTTVNGNSAHRVGGGLHFRVSNSSTGLIEDSRILQNASATRGGGGISLVADHSDVVISRTTVAQNTATSAGGILANLVGGAITLEQSTMSGNSATDVGGLAVSSSDLNNMAILRHSTITNNSADGTSTDSTGGVFAVGQDLALDIEHTIIAGNHVQAGTNLDLSRPASVPLNARYNLIGDGTGSGLAETSPGTPDVSGNVVGGPTHGSIDPLLAPLADNGGLMPTHALFTGSPAINLGDPNATAGSNGVPLFDQRGNPFPRVLYDRIDIGAIEYLDLLVDTLDDESDGDFNRGDLSLREAIELANVWSRDDIIRFDPTLTADGPATILLTQGQLKVTDDLTIIGPGANLLTIDASGNDPTPDLNDRKGSRVLQFDDGSNAVTTNTLVGLKLTGGDLYGSGGAIFSRENLTIVSSIISGNAITGDGRGFGGGVYAERPIGSSLVQLTVRDSIISGNSTDRFGGGIGTRRADLAVMNSTIQDNSARYGGGISSHDGSVTIASTTLQSNSAFKSGGGFFRQGGTTSIEASNIWINSADFGGGIEIAAGAMMILNCSFNSNQAVNGDGGAIRNQQGSLTVFSSVIHVNSAQRDGGAIFGPAMITRCEISFNHAGRNGGAVFSNALVTGESYLVSNTADQEGGAIYSFGGILDINGSTIAGNRASNSGGGIFFREREIQVEEGLEGDVEVVGELIVRSSTVTGNSSRIGGGLYANAQSPAAIKIQHATVAYNRAETIGGGVYIVGDGTTIDHSIFASNSAPLGRNITGLIGTSFAVAFSLVGHNANSGIAEAPVGSPDAHGNLVGGDMYGFIDPLLEAFQLPGEPTWINTMYMFRLLPDSSAIGAGDPAALTGIDRVPIYDQRGAPYTRVFGERIDIGAFELQPDPLPGDYNYDNAADAADYVVWRKFLGTSNDMADDDDNGVVDQTDGDNWWANFGSTLAAMAPADATHTSLAGGTLVRGTPQLTSNAPVYDRAFQQIRPRTSEMRMTIRDIGEYNSRIDLIKPALRIPRHEFDVEVNPPKTVRDEPPGLDAFDAVFDVLCGDAPWPSFPTGEGVT